MHNDDASIQSKQPGTSGLVWSQTPTTDTAPEDRFARIRTGHPANVIARVVASDHDESQVLDPNTTIWDWDPPIEQVEGPAPYHYELQGELLDNERERRLGKTEFTHPQAIANTRGGLVAGSSSSSSGSNTFAVPRQAQTTSNSASGYKRKSTADGNVAGPAKQPEPSKRLSRSMSESIGEVSPSPPNTHGISRSRSGTITSSSRLRSTEPDQSGAVPGSSRATDLRRSLTDSQTARKVFPIQVGDKLFRLSGASIASDAPSYLSKFFEEQLGQNSSADNVRTLYIDRDPATFEDISLHLKGYHIEPRDGPHFVKLFADAQFFRLPRLTEQLFSSPIYIRIGDEEFQIPRELFNGPGDSPNYFSLGFSFFFTSPSEMLPGVTERTLSRPPAILPPSVPNRSAKTFADILHILKGYPPEFRNEEHRNELLRDARHFHLKGLEQRLIPHSITYNLARKRSEILLKLEDLRQSGISIVYENITIEPSATSPDGNLTPAGPNVPGWVFYRRPYVDSEAHSLIVEVSGEEGMFITLAPGSSTSPARTGRVVFHDQALSRITGLFSVLASKMNLPITQPLGLMMVERGGGVASMPVSLRHTGLSDDRVKIRIGSDADVKVNGRKWTVHQMEMDDDDDNESDMEIDAPNTSRAARNQRPAGDSEGEDWVVRKSQWRLRFQPIVSGAQPGRSGMEVILGAVKIEAFSDERARNADRGFLG